MRKSILIGWLLVLQFICSIVHASEPTLIDSVTDSLGNVQTNSWTAGEGGNWPATVDTPVIVNVGDQVTFTVNATDPEGGNLQYNFAVQPPGGSFETKQDWSTSNTWVWTVDPSEYGPAITVFIAVKDDDGSDYQGSFGGDDYTYAIYDVENPSASSPAVIDSVTDSLGNVQTNSWTAGEGGNWPATVDTPVIVNVGDQVTFTVNATDPEGGNLQYNFAVQPPGGSFETKQDWSTSNTWVWTVDPSEYGPAITVFIAVKDDDGSDYQGSFGGDDYTYAIYDVELLDSAVYTVTPTVIGEHGTIWPDDPQHVLPGDIKQHTFVITPEEGYRVNNVRTTCNGKFSWNNLFETDIMTEDCEITVEFVLSNPDDFDGNGRVDLVDAIRALQVTTGQL